MRKDLNEEVFTQQELGRPGRRKKHVSLVFVCSKILAEGALLELAKHDLARFFARALIRSGLTRQQLRKTKR